MDDIDTTDDLGPLCRLCAHTRTPENLVYIFSDKDENYDNLADFININLPIKVFCVTSFIIFRLDYDFEI